MIFRANEIEILDEFKRGHPRLVDKNVELAMGRVITGQGCNKQELNAVKRFLVNVSNSVRGKHPTAREKQVRLDINHVQKQIKLRSNR